MLLVSDLSYRHSESFALEEIHLEIKKGEIVSLIGPNGSGKSTLLRIISHLLQPMVGMVLLDGKEIQTLGRKALAQKLAMLPQIQNHTIDITVRELVEFGRNPHKRWFQSLDGEDERIIQWALEVTNLQAYEYRFLQSLSGGERQRAWIAMAIAQRPDILLLDEPTTYLDIAHQLEVMELVRMLNEQFGMTIVMVLHDINQAAQYSDRIVALKDGHIRYDGDTKKVICKAMFQEIFDIDVEIYYDRHKPFFVPIRKKQDFVVSS
ncbi:ABC transporter ATP-binding protein [Anoxybacillus sp. J5B_2022]|uniref:ABC transporter ATP-binding protein n=1 Tax=Anoxybacillus sp. J5B_2022 TaxID=3003246 RepID=UPI00228581E0|nr:MULTISPECIES: ABC transporter ATP-binding protein [unclassified Anoxybacillus]MCL6587437.1 ABC transporter ATP-binding protein [Anoxybacillus sp.]MCZ0756222.1 ABC transporter ATP-binding protein [Anoxybacillus sp. J5B_2022]